MGQARPTINPDAFGDGDADSTPTPSALWVRGVPEIAEDLANTLSWARPGFLLELRESFHNHLEMWQAPGAVRDPLAMAHRCAGEEVWEAFARKLGLPELSGGGYR
jgi:hypothetical protein